MENYKRLSKGSMLLHMVYTANILYAARRIESGTVIVNDIPTFRVDYMPYGGVKESGYGYEREYAVQEMTELKFISKID
ncbi:aldehyde dehydrogenase family protein [Thermaerobacillus caldiproteolyticus]|nr:aldehyde dehydrogenase family protein [Anoxybacillus caldiproteolyticus]